MDMLDNDLTKIFTKEIDVPITFSNSIKDALYIKNSKGSSIKRFIVAFLIACISSIGVAFAGVNMHQYFTKVDKQNLDTAPGINLELDAKYGIKTYEENNNYFYKFITTYDDYIKCKERWNNLYEMEENDFENNYVLMVSWLGRNETSNVLNKY